MRTTGRLFSDLNEVFYDRPRAHVTEAQLRSPVSAYTWMCKQEATPWMEN